MQTLALTGGTLITPFQTIHDGVVLIEDATILAIGRKENIPVSAAARRIDVTGLLLLPGFIDLHTHGAAGVRASDGEEGLAKICAYLPRTGVTGWLPTLGQPEDIPGVVRAIEGCPSGARILGIHLEGPYLAPKDLPGQPKEPRLPDLAEYEKMLELAQGHLRLMGLAPELRGALELIAEMRRTGVVAAVAHSKATYEELMAAVDVGLRHVTHTFNVMSRFHHRRPGVVGGALTCDALTGELIGDGFHVSPVAMEILFRCKGAEKVALITDNSYLAGLEDGVYGDVEKRDGIIRRVGFTAETDGTMAGSPWPFDHNFRTVRRMTNRTLPEMAMICSTVPAQVVGVIEERGTLEPGKKADIVALDDDGRVLLSLVEGEVAWGDCSIAEQAGA